MTSSSKLREWKDWSLWGKKIRRNISNRKRSRKKDKEKKLKKNKLREKSSLRSGLIRYDLCIPWLRNMGILLNDIFLLFYTNWSFIHQLRSNMYISIIKLHKYLNFGKIPCHPPQKNPTGPQNPIPNPHPPPLTTSFPQNSHPPHPPPTPTITPNNQASLSTTPNSKIPVNRPTKPKQ